MKAKEEKSWFGLEDVDAAITDIRPASIGFDATTLLVIAKLTEPQSLLCRLSGLEAVRKPA